MVHSAQPRVTISDDTNAADLFNYTTRFCYAQGVYFRTSFFPIAVKTAKSNSDGTITFTDGPTYSGGGSAGAFNDLAIFGSIAVIQTGNGYIATWVIASDGSLTFGDELQLVTSPGDTNDIDSIGFDGLTNTLYVNYFTVTHAGGGNKTKSVSLDPTTGALGSLTDVGDPAATISADNGTHGFGLLIPGAGGRMLMETGRGAGHTTIVKYNTSALVQYQQSEPISGSSYTHAYIAGYDGFGVLGLPMVFAGNNGLPMEQWHYDDSAPGMVFDAAVTAADLGLSSYAGFEVYTSPWYDDSTVNAVISCYDGSFQYVAYAVVYDLFEANGPREVHVVTPSGSAARARPLLGHGDADKIEVLLELNTAVDGSGTASHKTELWDVGAPPPVNNAHCGDKVIRYTVTANTGLPYTVSPQGPNNTTHHGQFQIAAARTVSFMASLASDDDQDFYVQPIARFLNWNGTSFTLLSNAVMGSPVHMTGDQTWTTITRMIDAPEGATHWGLDFSVQGNSGGTLAPDIGTILYLDCVYVVENGMDLASEPYLDGDQVGTARGDGYWEGTAHDATSIWGAPEPDPGTGDPDVGGGDSGGTDPVDDPNDEPDTPGDPIPPAEQEIVVCPAVDLVTRRHSRNSFCPECLDGDVQLGDHLFNTIDEFGVFWSINDIDGWWNLPDPDIPDITRGIDDGSYQTRGRYSARVFTLSGSFFPPGPTEVRTARDRLIRAANLCHYGAWFATHEQDATRASEVWLSGRPSIATVNESGRTDFSIGLKAPDPIKYGLYNRLLPGWNSAALKSSSSTADFGRVYDRVYQWAYPNVPSGGVLASTATVVNEGNVRVSPIITVYGPTSGAIDIHNTTTSQTTRVRLGLAADDILLIDCQNRTVSLNGVPNKRLYLDTITDWIYLDPGPNKFNYTEETGSSSSFITVQWRSGWIG